MIKINNLKYQYKDRRHITFELSISNLEIPEGQVITFFGENGSGKTTLIDLITGNKHPLEGTIEFEGEGKNISAVFQESKFDDIPIESTLRFLDKANGNQADVGKLLVQLGLFNSRKKHFKALSFGQKQRFRFLVALLKPFTFLILDEIMTGIDYAWRKKVREILKEIIKNNKTVILISHDLEDISIFCNRVIIMEKGLIIDDFELSGNKKIKIQTLKDRVPFIKEVEEELGDDE